MKRRGPTAIGGKTIAQKVTALFTKMPAHLQAMVRHEITERAASTRERIASGGDGFEDPADLHDYTRWTCALAAIQGLVPLLDQLPGIPRVSIPIDAAEEEYGPGGPPMSPVHDSLFMTWSLLDLPFGRKHETIAQIAGQLAPRLQLDPDLGAAIDELASSRLGLYRVEQGSASRAGASRLYRVRELVTERELVLQFVEAYDIRPPDLLLARALELAEPRARARGATHLAFTTPYVLESTTDPEWLDYFGRVGSEGVHASKPAAYEAIMRGVGDPRRWLEYVFVGYAGERAKNMVRVVGIPDRPHTLPQHADYSDDAETAALDEAGDRERVTILSSRMARRLYKALEGQPRAGLQALADHFGALDSAGGDPEHWHQLVTPVVFYDVAPGGGAALCTTLSDKDLDRDEREFVEAAKRGFTSIFEVLDVNRGEGMRLRDLLGGDAFDVQERAATMNAPTRIVLFARLVRYRGIWFIDGMLPVVAPPDQRDAILARVHDRLGRSSGAGATPLVGTEVYDAMVAWQEAVTKAQADRALQPRPRLVATTGEEIAWSKAALAFDPSERPHVLDAIARLRGAFADSDAPEPDGTERFVVVDKKDSIEATLELRASLLTIESNTPGRLARVRKRIEQKIPGVLTLRSREVTPIDEMLANASPRAREPEPPEIAAALAQVIRKHYANFLDVPVPALGGDTPRAVARDPRRHAELDAFLRDHEHGVTAQHGPGVVDFAAMRRELGLKR